MVTKRGLLDFGAHGREAIRHEGPAGMYKRKVREYFTGRHGGLEPLETLGPHTEDRFNSKFSPEQSREATNYIKAVDRQDSGKDWDKDLGGGASFLQGPRAGSLDALIQQRESGDYVDPLMRMEADRKKAAIHARATEDENMLDEMAMDSEALDDWQQDQGSDLTERLDELDTESLGPDHMDQRGTQIDEVTGKYLGDNPFGVLGEKVSGAYGSVKDWFSSDDEKGGTKKKPLSETQKWGLNMLKDSLSAQDVRPPAIRAPSVIRGQVAFPGLLAASKAPVHPRYTPKGLIA